MSAEHQEEHSGNHRPAGGKRGDREFLKTGTYLHTYCPDCGYDLVEANWIRLGIVNDSGEHGLLRLSPRFNVFQRECDVELVPGTQIKDLVCPRCNASIVDSAKRCNLCDARTARLRVSIVRHDLDLFICLRVGCPWHGLSEEDEGRVVLEEERQE